MLLEHPKLIERLPDPHQRAKDRADGPKCPRKPTVLCTLTHPALHERTAQGAHQGAQGKSFVMAKACVLGRAQSALADDDCAANVSWFKLLRLAASITIITDWWGACASALITTIGFSTS